MSKKLLLWAMVAALSAAVSALIPSRDAEARLVLACSNEYCDGGELLLEPDSCRPEPWMTCHGGHILDDKVCDAHICG